MLSNFPFAKVILAFLTCFRGLHQGPFHHLVKEQTDCPALTEERIPGSNTKTEERIPGSTTKTVLCREREEQASRHTHMTLKREEELIPF